MTTYETQPDGTLREVADPPERVDLVQVVRCRDCVHYSEHEWVIATDVSDVCHFWHGKPTKVAPDGFCAWGCRKQ